MGFWPSFARLFLCYLSSLFLALRSGANSKPGEASSDWSWALQCIKINFQILEDLVWSTLWPQKNKKNTSTATVRSLSQKNLQHQDTSRSLNWAFVFPTSAGKEDLPFWPQDGSSLGIPQALQLPKRTLQLNVLDSYDSLRLATR